MKIFQAEFTRCQSILRDLDLLIEAHKQLSLAIEEPVDKAAEVVQPKSPVDCEELTKELSMVQAEIARLESLNSAIQLISTCSIPSVASSEPFLASLKLLLSTDQVKYAALINRAAFLMEKCWDNALVAMERVLDRDLQSLEDYLDDRVYKELRDRVLKPLLTVYKLKTSSSFVPLLEHFIASYSQLRLNSVTFILDTRLNNQFQSSKEDDQILHLIERARLLMVVETREFNGIFGDLDFETSTNKKAQLNKILETVGNLLYQRIEPLCRSLSPFQLARVSGFIHPLMKSILKNGENDPFGLFLKLLSEKHFPLIEGYKDPVSTTETALETELNPDNQISQGQTQIFDV